MKECSLAVPSSTCVPMIMSVAIVFISKMQLAHMSDRGESHFFILDPCMFRHVFHLLIAFVLMSWFLFICHTSSGVVTPVGTWLLRMMEYFPFSIWSFTSFTMAVIKYFQSVSFMALCRYIVSGSDIVFNTCNECSFRLLSLGYSKLGQISLLSPPLGSSQLIPTALITWGVGPVGHPSSTPWPHLLAAFWVKIPPGVPYLG